MAPLSVLPVQNSRVTSDPVVPHDDSLFLPLHPRLEVRTKSDMVEQELQQKVALLLLEANDPPSELWVHIQCLGKAIRGGLRGLVSFGILTFSPVTGCVLTIGCTLLTGSLLTTDPRARAAAACS